MKTVSERLRSNANMCARVNAAVALLCEAAFFGANEIERLEKQRDELLAAELAKLREQEPVAYVKYKATGGNVGLSWVAIPTGAYYPREGEQLYAAPIPAAPAVPEATCNDNLQVPREWREMLEFLISQRGKAGHSHRRPGIWDDDNGVLAGKPCDVCAMYDRARAIIGAKP